jgi:hypothetical protein
MSSAGQKQTLADAFEHEPHTCIHFSQASQVSPSHHSRVGMGQQFGFNQHGPASLEKVVERAPVAPLSEKISHLRVNRLRLVTQTEEHLGATQQLSLTHDVENFIRRHRLRACFVRRLAKRAVAAEVAAKVRQRHEHFR